jgi:hypothetical protein
MSSADMNSKTVLAHLKYARRRSNLLFLVGPAALLAWWATPMLSDQPNQLDQAYAAYENFGASAADATRLRDKISRWVKDTDLRKLEAAEIAVQGAGSDLNIAGAQTAYADSFVLIGDSPISHLKDGWDELHEQPLTATPLDWNREQLENFAGITGGYELTASEVNHLNAAIAEFTIASREERFASDAHKGLTATDQLQNALADLRRTPPPTDASISLKARTLAKAMRAIGIETPTTLSIAAIAQQLVRSLKEGSLEVLGFSIPGLVVRMLLPLIGFGVSLDLALNLRRTRRLIRRALSRREAHAIVMGFPWLFPPSTFTRRREWRLMLDMIYPILLLTAPAIFLLPLTLSTRDLALKVASLLAIGAMIICLICSIQIVMSLAWRGARRASSAKEISLSEELLASHFAGTEAIESTILVVSVAILAFFLGFIATPAELLNNHGNIEAAAATRELFEIAYNQRLRDNAKEFAEWCKEGGDRWTESDVALDKTPPSHPAYAILTVLKENPIVIAEMSATANLPDVVGESRANFADLDRQDLTDVRELLYRDSFDPIVVLLGKLQEAIQNKGLSMVALYKLPGSDAQAMKMRRTNAVDSGREQRIT